MIPTLFVTFLSCCSAVIFLELLIKVDPGCGNVVTLCAFLFIAAEGFITTMKLGQKTPQVPLTEWLKLVLFFFIVNVINNAIFKYQIAVPLYTVFRSGSLAASLMAEKIVMSRTHSSQKHLSVCLITIGIIMCTFESAKTLENQSNFIDWSIGIVMLSTSLVLSALMGVNQERIFAKWGNHYEEALFFTHFLPLPGFLLLYEDILTHFSNIIHADPKFLPFLGFQIPQIAFLFGNIVSQYICARSIFKMSSQLSSLTITAILCFRKFISILLSVWIFDNVFTSLHWLGTFLVFIGIILFSDKSKNKVS